MALTRQLGAETSRQFKHYFADGCLLGGSVDGEVVAISALGLESARIAELYVSPRWRRQGLGSAMLDATERLAVSFGITSLYVPPTHGPAKFWTACGYHQVAGQGQRVRKLARRQTRYGARIAGLLERLGISADYGQKHRLRLQGECAELQSIGKDALGRETFLAPPAAQAWQAMSLAAADDGVELQPASAFRSVDYQAGIIERKLARGLGMDEILAVSAAPGYSEHHSGRAVDVTTPGTRSLEIDFESTPAYRWLHQHAAAHGFRLSYPRDNRHGIAYEPWHWYYTDG